jgi:hypothetical protein
MDKHGVPEHIRSDNGHVENVIDQFLISSHFQGLGGEGSLLVSLVRLDRLDPFVQAVG